MKTMAAGGLVFSLLIGPPALGADLPIPPLHVMHPKNVPARPEPHKTLLPFFKPADPAAASPSAPAPVAAPAAAPSNPNPSTEKPPVEHHPAREGIEKTRPEPAPNVGSSRPAPAPQTEEPQERPPTPAPTPSQPDQQQPGKDEPNLLDRFGPFIKSQLDMLTTGSIRRAPQPQQHLGCRSPRVSVATGTRSCGDADARRLRRPANRQPRRGWRPGRLHVQATVKPPAQ
jgi:hypothetical protein